MQLLKTLGTDATVDYKLSDAEIISEVKSLTSNKLNLIFDAVSVNNTLAASVFSAIPSTSKPRFYTTTNDWDPAPNEAGFTTTKIGIGPIGRPEAVELNKRLSEFIKVIVKLLEKEVLRAGEYTVEGEGIEGILPAWEVQKSGKAGSKKVLVKVADV